MKRILIFIFALPALAAAAPPDPATLAAIKKVKAGDYPSANTVLITDDQSVVYQEDGQYSNTIHSVRLVLTPAGKNETAHAAMDYAKDAEKLEVLTAQVIKADGAVVAVPDSAIQDTEASGEMNIYDPNGRSKKITFGALAVGDAVELTWKLTRLTPTRPNFFDDQFMFQSTAPIVLASYQVDAPASRPLTSVIYNQERGSKIQAGQTRAGDRIHYQWSAANIPQLVPEMLMNAQMEMPLLVVTTDPSWEHFSKWWAEVSEPQMQPTDELKAKVAELTKDAKTDDEKIRALYDFVSSDIRYRGLGVGPRTGYTPRKAMDTLTSRWGVCRDVAILLSAMLRQAGFPAYPVLTMVGSPVLPKVAYQGFNHAIVAMPNKDGTWTYLDPTAKNMNQFLPAEEAEQDTLVCTAKGEKLSRTPAAAPANNLGHAVATSVVADDGSLTSSVKIDSKGLFDMLLRTVAATTSPRQQRDLVESLIDYALPDAELVDFKLSNPLFLGTPMTAEMTIKVPEAALQVGDYRLLRTLVSSGALGLAELVAPQLLGGLPSRKYVLDAHVTFQWDEDETVTLPAWSKVQALPNDASVANPVSELTSKCTQVDATTISCHRSFKLKSRFIDPKQYLELRGVLASVGQIAHQPVILNGAGER